MLLRFRFGWARAFSACLTACPQDDSSLAPRQQVDLLGRTGELGLWAPFLSTVAAVYTRILPDTNESLCFVEMVLDILFLVLLR